MQAPPELDGPSSRSFRRGGEGGRGKTQAFELKGMVAPLTVLRLRTPDVALIERQLRLKVAEMPQFFQDAPVLLDLGALGPSAAKLPFADLAKLLRACKMVPVAVTQAEGETRTRAAAAGFGYVAPSVPRAAGRASGLAPANAAAPTSTVAATDAPALSQMAAASTEPRPAPVAHEPSAIPATATPATATPATTTPATTTPAAAPVDEKTPAPAAAASPPRLLSHRPPVVVRQPVRSGQIIYAEATDLVILAPVNPGAEVIADGHVHIYSTLRGRAVAGAQGMTEARIFCQKLEAELVAISGAYLLADDLPADRRGKPAQIHLEDGVCKVTAL